MSHRRALMLLSFASALADPEARAEDGGAPGQQRPPVRATSTVDVISTEEPVDEIIARMRAQQRSEMPAPAPRRERRTRHAGDERHKVRDRGGDHLSVDRAERPRVRPDRGRPEPVPREHAPEPRALRHERPGHQP